MSKQPHILDILYDFIKDNGYKCRIVQNGRGDKVFIAVTSESPRGAINLNCPDDALIMYYFGSGNKQGFALNTDSTIYDANFFDEVLELIESAFDGNPRLVKTGSKRLEIWYRSWAETHALYARPMDICWATTVVAHLD